MSERRKAAGLQDKLRRHAERWSLRMARRLIARDDRGVTWHKANCLALIERARKSLDEMELGIECCVDPDMLADKAADAANLAMMAADSWGLLGVGDD